MVENSMLVYLGYEKYDEHDGDDDANRKGTSLVCFKIQLTERGPAYAGFFNGFFE